MAGLPKIEKYQTRYANPAIYGGNASGKTNFSKPEIR